MAELKQIPIELLDEPLLPMREQFGDAPFQELVEDIGKNGIVTPLGVRPVGERFRVFKGHRRLKAAQVCALRELPCIVEDVDDFAEVRGMIAENTGREDVSDAEKGRHYLGLMEQFKLNLEQVAAMVGKSVEYVDQRVSFVQCDPEIADANVQGLVSWAVSRELLRVNPATMALVFRVAVAEIGEEQARKCDAHRKFLLDLCIRCGATGKVAHSYVEQWKQSLVPVQPYVAPSNGDAVAPPVEAMAPRCVICGRDSNPGAMVPLMVHHYEKARVFDVLRAAGLQVFE